MPHIAVEASSSLLTTIKWEPVFQALHAELADRGWAALADLKSRVTLISAQLCGADPQAQQLIVTLTLTNPRPPETSAAMARMVFDHLNRAIDAHLEIAAWVQCCVFLKEHPKSHYLKRHWNAPPSSAT